jgi:hypothetical protein
MWKGRHTSSAGTTQQTRAGSPGRKTHASQLAFAQQKQLDSTAMFTSQNNEVAEVLQKSN